MPCALQRRLQMKWQVPGLGQANLLVNSFLSRIGIGWDSGIELHDADIEEHSFIHRRGRNYQLCFFRRNNFIDGASSTGQPCDDQ